MKTLNNFNLKNKRILLRLDLNSDVVNGEVMMNERIKEAARSILYFKDKNCKVVILAHQGRPGNEDFISLKQHAKLLNKFVKVKFIDDIIGKKAITEIKKLKNKEVLLLDNVRFLKEEFKLNINNKFVKNLKPYFDLYVNDAFSNSHREQTSMVSFPKVMFSCIGKLVEKELKNIRNIELKGTLYILGGAKPEEDMILLGKRKVLTCGLFGQICTIAKGYNLGAQNKFLKDKLKVIPKLKNKLRNVKTPLDFAIRVNGKRRELKLEEFPSKYEIFDIGSETIKLYTNEIKQAKSIFMKGPPGYYEDVEFRKGLIAILNAIVKYKKRNLIGGGNLSEAVMKLKIKNKNRLNVSLSGGALLEYIAGKKLPGLEALK